MKSIAIIFFVFLQIFSSLSLAESSDKPPENLFNIKTLKCEFCLGLTVNWDKGVPVYSESNSTMSFFFSAIDPQNRTATIIGNGGSAKVSVLINKIKGISFIEQTPSGNLIFTTIFNTLLASTNKYIAVHSRHVDIFNPFPSQYHGECVPWE